ncbi:DUF2798 domain-containing protein [Halodurantibacterium flavum]|uniref:DUF2798 domain-containing protein n=1 Tax=Halodurantibacterium flavum TaxID=1382802 RepID=A0ABW4S422_9RHOB
MIPQKYAHILFAFFLSGMMSLIITAIATLRTSGLTDGFVGIWLGAWVPGWAVAFPAVLVVAPVTRRIVAALTR